MFRCKSLKVGPQLNIVQSLFGQRPAELASPEDCLAVTEDAQTDLSPDENVQWLPRYFNYSSHSQIPPC